MFKAILIGSCLVWSAGPLLAQDAKTAKDTAGIEILQSPSGMTLYVFDNDRLAGGQPGPSTCYEQCAKLWPPFVASADAKPNGAWTTVARKDGTSQWAYKGRPIYTFTRDAKPGEEQGNSFNGNKWHVALP